MKSLTVIVNMGSEFTHKNKDVLYWNSEESNEEQMLSSYLEKNKEKIRNTYLDFVDELANKRINDKSILNSFSLDSHHNLWTTSLINEKCPIKSPQVIDCLKLICLEKILIKKQIKQVKLYSYNHNISQSIELLCSRKKIKLIRPKNISIKRIFSFFRVPMGLKTFIFIFRIGLKYIKLSETNHDLRKCNSKISIFSYLLNFEIKKNNKKEISFHSNYWNKLPEIISKKFNGTNWFHLPIEFQKNNYLIKEDFKSSKLKDNHNIISDYLTLKIFFKSILLFLRYYLKNFNFDKRFSCFNLKKSDVNLCYLLQEDWDKSFKGSNLFYSIMMINLFDSILSNIPKQKIGLYLYENQAWEKCLISSWNKFKHGKLIGVAHSTVRFWDLRYFKSKKILRNPISMKNEFPNNIAVNGTLASSALLKGGYDKKLLLKTEALRFLYLNKYLDNKNNIKSKKIKKILLIGDIDKKNTIELLRSINTIKSQIKEYNITFRSHPGQILDNQAKILNILNSRERLLEVDINRNDMVIVSGSSSVALEVLFLNKPLVVYLSKDKLNLSPLSDFKEIHFASTPKSLLESIISSKYNTNIIKKDSFYLDKRLTYWKANLDKIFHEK